MNGVGGENWNERQNDYRRETIFSAGKRKMAGKYQQRENAIRMIKIYTF